MMDLIGKQDEIFRRKIIERIECCNCTNMIIQYYNENYKGMRGKCPNCLVEFPLD